MNASSGLRRPAFWGVDSRVLASAGCRIRRIRKGHSEMLPMLTWLVKRVTIQCEPRMAIEFRNLFSHTTMKENRIPQSPREPIEGQRSWKAIPLFVIRKQRKPAIHIVDQILHHRLVRPPRHRARTQSVQHQWQTLSLQQKTNPRHNQAHAQHGPILWYESNHDGFSVARLNENSTMSRFQIQGIHGLNL